MSSPLPDLTNPWRLVQLHKGFAGTASAEALPRLSAAVLEVVDGVEYRLLFARNEQRRAVLSGEVRAQVQLECRRCLQPVLVPLHSILELTLVGSEAEAERLAEKQDELDLVVLADEPMRPLELIEDELLLSLPAYPCHPQDACIERLAEVAPEDDEVCETPTKTLAETPFAVLARLKT